MESYELTIVLPGATSASKKKQVISDLEELVKSSGGKVIKTDDWGEKELSYLIKGNKAGLFVHFQLELTKESVLEITGRIRLTKEIIRHLIVKI